MRSSSTFICSRWLKWRGRANGLHAGERRQTRVIVCASQRIISTPSAITFLSRVVTDNRLRTCTPFLIGPTNQLNPCKRRLLCQQSAVEYTEQEQNKSPPFLMQQVHVLEAFIASLWKQDQLTPPTSASPRCLFHAV